jgi:DUF1680 family protein
LYASLTKTHSGFETPCGSYAHFKLTRALLRVTRDGRYGDSIERVLYNTVLGVKPLETDGHAFYYSDYNVSGRKVYFPDAWPCCSGTLPQVAADYRLLIYLRDSDGFYVNLYLPSTLRYTAPDGAQVALSQTGNYPLDGNIMMNVRTSKASSFLMRLRIPAWASSGVSIAVNGESMPTASDKGFVTLRRTWKDGDRIQLQLPMPARLEAIDELHPSTVALVRGPLVLFGLTGDTHSVSRQQLLSVSRADGEATWQVSTEKGPLRLRPFSAINDEPYVTYFNLA